MDDIFEPKFHKAWNEALIKENKIRLRWYEDQANKEKEEEKLLDEEYDDDYESPYTCKDNETTFKQTQKTMDWPRKGAVGTSTIIRVTDGRSAMRQPPSALKCRLYGGTGHDGNGRIDYLKRRGKEGPSEKFRSRVVTSWDYGWHYRTGENELNCKRPPQLCNIKQKAFFTP